MPEARQPKRQPKILEKAEVEALLRQPNTRCPTGLRNRAILELMYRGGLRVGEICALRPGDIRWQAREILVRGKGQRERTVPLEERSMHLLERWAEKRPAARNAFFCTLRGGRISSRYVQQMVKREAQAAGLDVEDRRVTPHVLRHTYATELLDEGLTIREVQHLLGHSSVATTQIYTQIRPQAIREKIAARSQAEAETITPGAGEQLGAFIEMLTPEQKKALAGLLKQDARDPQRLPVRASRPSGG